MEKQNWPFRTNKSQKIGGIIIFLIGGFIMVGLSILPATKDYINLTSIIGFVITLIGVGYYLASFD